MVIAGSNIDIEIGWFKPNKGVIKFNKTPRSIIKDKLNPTE
jgi:hypothetical protein